MTATGVKLGGADRASISLIRSFLYGLMFSPEVETTPELTEFLIQRYFENGAALYGRESIEELIELNNVSGLYSTEVQEIYDLAEYYVHRARLYVRAEGLGNLGFMGKVVSFPGEQLQDHPCSDHIGRVIDLSAAAEKVNKFRKLPHEDYAGYVFNQDHGFPPYKDWLPV